MSGATASSLRGLRVDSGPGSGQAGPTPRLIALVQGIYYLITGIWPLLHLPSFEAVSGPKTDKWLVRTVGVLITVIGAVLCLAAARQKPLSEPEIASLALGSTAGLTAIEVVYVAKGRISPIYLLDALLEIAVIAAWLFVPVQMKRSREGAKNVKRDCVADAASVCKEIK